MLKIEHLTKTYGGKPAVQEGLCRGCHRCAKECVYR